MASSKCVLALKAPANSACKATNTMHDWTPIDAPIGEGLNYSGLLLEELAAGDIPAIILRNAWQPERCQNLVDRLIQEDLLLRSSQRDSRKNFGPLQFRKDISRRARIRKPPTPGIRRKTQAGHASTLAAAWDIADRIPMTFSPTRPKARQPSIDFSKTTTTPSS